MKIPKYIIDIIKKIEQAGFEVFIVGGSLRDLLLKKNAKDWDLTTNAKPEEILKIFPEGKYENSFGTVLLPFEEEGVRKALEITTYRSEQGYSDRRHPDKIIFEKDLEKDLERRDFTINALAMLLPDSKNKLKTELKKYVKEVEELKVIDLFGGFKDLQTGIIRAVGEPSDRFKEDGLRMMRAIRLAAQLNFVLEPKTKRAIGKLASSIRFIAKERIRDELIKILSSGQAYDGLINLHETGLLNYIIPELEKGVDVKQDRHHIYNVFKHSLLSLKSCPSPDWRVRLAALFHDIAKPQTKKIIDGISTFYNHEYLGAKISDKILSRLRFSNEDREKIVTLVRNHMFYYNVDEVTAASVRRLIKKVGQENLKDLIDLRIADRLGSGTPKAKPYKLRHLEYMFKRVQNDPVSVKMLKINGSELMDFLKIKPSPKVGAILDVLLAEVIEDVELNNKEYLKKRSQELNELEIEELRERAKTKIEEKKQTDDEKMKKNFWVK